VKFLAIMKSGEFSRKKKFGLNTRVHNFLAVKTKKNRWAKGAGTKVVPEKIITGEIRKR